MNPLLEQFRLCPAPTESNSPSTKISRCHTEKSWKIFLIFFFLFLITPPTRPLFNCITKKKKNTLRNNKRGKNKRASGSELSIFQNYSCDLHRRMDQQEMIDEEGWTEERHAAFLNWMEESFVLRMFSPNSKKATGFWSSQQCSPATCRDLPLNRLIPDSATESTGDSRPRRSRLLVESGRFLFDK